MPLHSQRQASRSERGSPVPDARFFPRIPALRRFEPLDHLLRERPKGAQLPAHHAEHPFRASQLLVRNELVPTADCGLWPPGHFLQRPQSRVGVADPLPCDVQARHQLAGLGDQVVDVRRQRPDRGRLAVEPVVGRADQQQPILRHGEKHPAVALRGGEERVTPRWSRQFHHDVRAAGDAQQFGRGQVAEFVHGVHPWPSRVHHCPGGDQISRAAVLYLDRRCRPFSDHHPHHAGVVLDVRALRPRFQCHFQR